MKVLKGINTRQNDAIIRKNAVSDDIIIQKVPLPTWPLYKKQLYIHGRYTSSTFTYISVIQEAPLHTWPLNKKCLYMAIIQDHLYQYRRYAKSTFTYMTVIQEIPLPT